MLFLEFRDIVEVGPAGIPSGADGQFSDRCLDDLDSEVSDTRDGAGCFEDDGVIQDSQQPTGLNCPGH